jgi:pimeloyl-ACP methyl ester carboxylesterase
VETDAYKNQRELRVINFYGAPVPKDPVKAIQAEVEAITTDGPDGKIVIVGSSIGGKNAAHLAFHLQQKFKLSYVALLDAGYDNASDPDRSSAIRAGRADSFYESTTNDWKDIMGDVEFHGVATGTSDANVENMSPLTYTLANTAITAIRRNPSKDLPGYRAAFAAAARGLFKKAHDQAVGDGNKRAIPVVISALKI